MQLLFGSGSAFVGSNTAAQPEIQKLGVLQDITLDFDRTIKELSGTYQAPVAIAAGALKITGKAKLAQFSIVQWNNIFGGQTLNTGQVNQALDEPHSIPGTPYQVTVTNGTTMVDDLGVRYKTTGLPLVPVASAPAVGQYVRGVAGTGQYTFAAADTLANILMSYSYTTAGSGSNVLLPNPVQGVQPTFTLWFNTTFTVPGQSAQQLTYKLNNCIISKWSMPTKMADWNIMEIDFQAFADLSNNLLTVSAVE